MVKLAISYNAYKCSSYITHYDDILLALLEYREKSVRALILKRWHSNGDMGQLAL